MKVRLSREAKAYIREETQYLSVRSQLAAENFLARMSEAQTILSRFPDIGVGRESLPIAGSRRLVTARI